MILSFKEANPNMLGPFVFGRYLESYFEKEVKVDCTKIDPADLDSPCQELLAHGLGFVVALFSGIYFVCVSTGGPIQL